MDPIVESTVIDGTAAKALISTAADSKHLPIMSRSNRRAYCAQEAAQEQ